VADRDFAQLQATVKADVSRASGASGLRAVLLVVGIFSVVIMGFVGGYWLGSRQGRESEVVAAKARLEAQLEAQQKELEALRQQAKSKAKSAADTSPTTEVGELTFYTDLPKQSVKPQPLSQPLASPQMPSSIAPAPSPASSAPPSSQPAPAPATEGSGKMMQSIIQRELARNPSASPAAPAKDGSYYVQVASFRDANEAAAMQRKLQGAGFTSRIQRADIPGRGSWYRLQSGPYPSHDAADAARIELGKKMHMKGIVIRGGG
jgi:DedD protein